MKSYRQRRIAGTASGLLALFVMVGLLSLAFRSATPEDSVVALADAQEENRPDDERSEDEVVDDVADIGDDTTASVSGGSTPAVKSTGDKPAKEVKGASKQLIETIDVSAPGMDPEEGNGFRSFATATGLYIPKSESLEKGGAKIPSGSISQTAAGAVFATTGLRRADVLGNTLLEEEAAKDVVGYASAAVAAGEVFGDGEQNGMTVTESTKADSVPPPVPTDAEFILPEIEPTVKTAQAEAATMPGSHFGNCDFKNPISQATTHVAGARLGELVDHETGTTKTNPFVKFEGALDSSAVTRLVPGIKPGRAAVSSSSVVKMPSITLFPGTPGAIEFRIKTPMKISAIADGTLKGTKYKWETVDPDTIPAFPEVYIGGKKIDLGIPEMYPEETHGLAIPLGYNGYILFGGLEQSITKTGTSVAASADFIVIVPPDPYGDPSALVYGPVFTVQYFMGPAHEYMHPAEDALAPILESVDQAFAAITKTGLLPELPKLPSIRLGHVEAQATVPPGGVRC